MKCARSIGGECLASSGWLATTMKIPASWMEVLGQMKAYREIRIREVKGRRTLLPAGGPRYFDRPGRREAARGHCCTLACLAWTGGQGTEP
jgi:hypothetical protein